MIDAKNPIRINHQKGHIERHLYVPHVDRKKIKKQAPRQQINKPPR